jgi:outer membrane protein insertion porin family
LETAPGAEPGSSAEPRVLVSEVVVTGAKGDLENTVYQAIRTKPGQTATRSQLQEDINAIFATGYFANVKATPEDTPLGVRVTFDVESNPVLKTVQVSGNTVIPAAEVDEIFKDQYGTILNLRQLQRGIQELSKRYQDKGYVLAQVVDVPKIGTDGTVTLDVAEGVVENIEIKFLNKQGEDKDAKGNPIKGRTRPYIVTREFQTKPGKVFNRNIAEKDLQRVFGLGIFEDVKLSLNPGQDPRKVVVVANVVERSPGSISAGGGVSSASGLFGTVSYQQQNLAGRNQKFGAEFEIGQREALFDLNFTDPWIAGDPFRTSYNINAFRRRTISLIFDGGADVRIQNENGVDTDRPVIIRTGGGVTFSRPLSKDVFSTSPWSASLGFGYQQVLIQDGDGNRVKGNTPQLNSAGQTVGVGSDLSFSGTGKDDLLTVQLGLLNDRRNDPLRPTSGSIFRVGTEQSIPLGSGSILFNRLRGSYSFYQPTRLLKLTPECQNRNSKLVPALQKQVGVCQQAFAFNVQAGTVLGDLPPYEAFSLGGSNSVRGYDEGEVGSGKTFLQATAEYRFPVFSIVSGACAKSPATGWAMAWACGSSRPWARFGWTMDLAKMARGASTLGLGSASNDTQRHWGRLGRCD